MLPGLGGLAAGKAGGAELRHVEDDVVGGERQHHGIRVALARHRGGGRDGRAGIPPQRLDHHRRLDADVLGLPAGEEMEIRAGDDDGGGEHRVLHAQQGFLVGRTVADQRQELLGQGVARDRPKPRPGAAGEKNGDDRRGHGYGRPGPGSMFRAGIVLMQFTITDYRYRSP